MLLLNAIIALIGIAIAVLVVQLKLALGLTGIALILVAFLGFWAYLTLSDVVEEWLIAKFNQEGR